MVDREIENKKRRSLYLYDKEIFQYSSNDYNIHH